MKYQLLRTIAFILIATSSLIGCCDKKCSPKGTGVDDKTLGTLSSMMTSYDAGEADAIRKELVDRLKKNGFDDLVIEVGPRHQYITYKVYNSVDEQTQNRICDVLEIIRNERKSKPMTVKFFREEELLRVVELK